MLAAKSKYRLLLVDDDEPFRELLRRHFEHEECDCDLAGDGVIAGNMARVKRYDAVITDLRMPRKHGYQLVQEILELRNPPLIVAMTGVVEPKIVGDLMGRGVVDIVLKPFDFNFFVAKIIALIERNRSLKKKQPEKANAGRDPETPTQSPSDEDKRLSEKYQEIETAFRTAALDWRRQLDEIEKMFGAAERPIYRLHHIERRNRDSE